MTQRKPDFVIKTAVYVTDSGLAFESKTDVTPKLKNNAFADDVYRYMAKVCRAVVSCAEGPDLPVKEKPGAGYAKGFKKRVAQRLVK